VCKAWEAEASAAETLGLRVVRLRTGVVLDARGGALKRMLPAFRMGAAGRLGSGKQWMAWVHAQDVAELYRFAAEQNVSGPLNATAPVPVTNSEFTKTLGAALKRPTLFPMPEFALRTIFGEMGSVLTASQRALPKAAQDSGFQFRFPQLSAALADLVKL
jgi:uncharacterized protein (TIGR01777 family)